MSRLPRFLGLRTIKTFISILLSVLIMTYIVKDTPFFACIGAVVAMEKTISNSLQAAIVRNVATVVGGTLGVVFSLLTENPILLSAGIIPHIYICNLIKRSDSIVAGAIVYFAVVFLNFGDEATIYGFRRMAGTLIGSLVAIAVNFIILPPKNTIN